ncbi:Alpha/Beta hydrolase protein [Clohesyomyces aquaticus]|uniref:Alpha/Beta hydrolase protein n=1 Tax=Clohesyomyces aquaticus TaxID=1231657 RepID=A0A1Y2AB65_9PLEO|nr:Alpha/Beta hydrolase protein [Clohesyomyces aquaticus]
MSGDVVVLRGSDPSHPTVHQWLGVPFGTPPVSNLRFLSAVPALYYGGGPHAAVTYKPICYQNSDTSSSDFWTLVPEFQNTDDQSEDCLYLNIWAPKKPAVEKKKVPVLVWVCGGGFAEGGGHAPYQVPDRWIERTQSHIVVTFNYRLNVLGFPAAAGALGNPGLSDIRLVVEWVRGNIEGFGGDPNHIVMWDDPIVTGLIPDSGSSNLDGSLTTNSTGFSMLAQSFNCGKLTAAAELACMQMVEALELQAYIRNTTGSVLGNTRFWGTVADNVTVFANNTQRLVGGKIAKVPLITGVNRNEGGAFGAFSLNQTVGPDPAQVEMANVMFVCGVGGEADNRAKHGLTTYRYLFKGNFSNITPRYWLGAMHSFADRKKAELPVVFGTHDLFRGNSTELEWQTSYSMEAFWFSFTANSTTALVDDNGLAWPKYGGENSAIMVFGDDGIGKAAQV